MLSSEKYVRGENTEHRKSGDLYQIIGQHIKDHHEKIGDPKPVQIHHIQDTVDHGQKYCRSPRDQAKIQQ
jgi:hypothetical protein